MLSGPLETLIYLDGSGGGGGGGARMENDIETFAPRGTRRRAAAVAQKVFPAGPSINDVRIHLEV